MNFVVEGPKESRPARRFVQRQTILAAAVAAVLAGGFGVDASAAGLGRLTVHSGLGQPLRAEVEVTSVSAEDSDSVSARLASPAAFKQAGRTYSSALGSLNFSVDKRADGRMFVRIASAQPINEPFVDLLVELNSSAGRFVREYTFLLDPPELRAARSESVDGRTVTSSVVPPATQTLGQPAPIPAAQARSAGALPRPASTAAETAGTAASAPAAAAPAAAVADVDRNSPNADVMARARAAVARSYAGASIPPAAASGAPSAAANAPTRAGSRAADARNASAGAQAQSGGQTVSVRPGDTLASIAARVRPADVAVEQAIVSIYRANPQAFFGSVHQLRAGRSLTVPDRDTMASVDAGDARREIRMQAANFNAYRTRIAERARRVETAQAGSTAAGAVTARVDEKGAPAVSGDQLRLSRGAPASEAGAQGSTSSATGSAEAQVRALESKAAEAKIASDAAVREQRERVAVLEKNVADLQKLLELKNQQLSQLQQQAEAGRAPMAGASVASPAAVSPSRAAEDKASAAAPASTPESKPVQAPVAPVAPASDSATALAQAQPAADSAPAPAASSVAGETRSTTDAAIDTAAAAVGAAASTAAAGAAAGTSAGVAEPPSAAPSGSSGGPATAEPAAQAAPKPPAPRPAAARPAATPVKAPPPPEPSLVDSLLASPYLMPGLAGLLVATGAAGFYTMRRRRAEEFEDTALADEPLAANSLFGTTGGQDVDTSNPSMFAPSELDSAPMTEDAPSAEVDPIAEAEVYIAYGRETQAEEILREALRREPDRHAIRLKLAELLAARRDAAGVAELANEMHARTGGRGEDWARLVEIGRSVDPANALFGGSAEPDMPGMVFPPTAVVGAGAAAAAATAANVLSPAIAGEVETTPAAEISAREIFAQASDAPAVARAAPQPAVTSEPPLDFSLDIDTSLGRADESLEFLSAEEPAVPAPVASAVAESKGISQLEQAVDGRFELPSLDFGNNEPQTRKPFGATSDTDVAVPAAAVAGKSAVEASGDVAGMSFDLPSFDELNLGAGKSGEAVASSEPAALDFGVGGASDDGSPQWQEMATKLDLASAYEEIGDKDGARELLEEVVRDGDGEQKRKAQAMLAAIG